MAHQQVDLFVIGGGSGGVRAARVAAGLGARVALAEERYLGGTCVNVGCIPKKLLVYAAHYGCDLQDAVGFGWTIEGASFRWPALIANKDLEIARLQGIYRALLVNSGVEVIDGRATLTDAHTIAAGGECYDAKHILIATGGWPMLPEIPGIEHAITSNEAFQLAEMPRRAVIVGGGYIAVEFAGIFNGLGVDTALVHRGPMFLRGFDQDVRETLCAEMRQRGVGLHFESNVSAIENGASGLTLHLAEGRSIETDLVLYATGRLPNTRGIGLENAGVELTFRGAVAVDGLSRSSQPHIYAVGDCTDRIALTPVAIAEGHAVALTLFGGKEVEPDYSNVATAVFSQPPVGTVGLTEEQARQQHGEIDIYRSTFRPLKHTLSGRDEKTMIKLVIETSTGRVLGCHMVGEDAGEIIQGFAVALRCGATKAQFDATVGIHPTAAEEFVTMRQKLR
ncbi:MAG TPA: glutathione-disulfide reductase [Terriglobales bacterium]|nr:glutathione-disulfide reductase [Terriglobales bacterium]